MQALALSLLVVAQLAPVNGVERFDFAGKTFRWDEVSTRYESVSPGGWDPDANIDILRFGYLGDIWTGGWGEGPWPEQFAEFTGELLPDYEEGDENGMLNGSTNWLDFDGNPLFASSPTTFELPPTGVELGAAINTTITSLAAVIVVALGGWFAFKLIRASLRWARRAF